MKYNKIALVGMMGSGKSTISAILAKKLNFSLFEMDEIFEKENNILIKDYFKKYGEDSFREKETLILKKLSKETNIILSTGGGIVLKEENRNILFNSDILSIYLDTKIDTIYRRIKEDTKRPLLLVENPKMEIEKILSQRENLYKQAKYQIKTDNKTERKISEEILNILWTK